MNELKKQLNDELNLMHIRKRYLIDKRLDEKEIYFGQPPILCFLRESPGATQKDIAEALHISPPSIAVSVKRMEKSGLICRETDKNDARRNNLFLTEKGVEQDDFARATFDSIDETLLSNLTDEEIECVLKVIKKMNGNLSAHIPDKCKKLNFTKEENSDVQSVKIRKEI